MRSCFGYRVIVAIVVISGFVSVRLGGTASADPSTPDASFASGGTVRLPGLEVNALAVQSNDDIVAGSWNYQTKAGSVTRLLPDGQIDTSFATSGVATVPMTPESVLISSNGDIFAIGWQTSDDDGVIAEFQPNGQAVSTFGTAGVASIACPSEYLELLGAALTPAGDIAIAGICGGAGYAAVVDSNGELDPTFGATENASFTSFNSVLSRSDGSFIFAGNTKTSVAFEGFSARATSLTGFTDGSMTSGSEPTLLPSPSGGFFMADAFASYEPIPTVSAWNSDGSIHDSFGFGTGFGTLDLAHWNDYGAAAIAPDGSFVLVGGVGVDGQIGRLTPDGLNDENFVLNGSVPLAAQYDPYAVVVKPNGQIVTAGTLGGQAVVEQLDGGSLQPFAGFTPAPGAAVSVGIGPDNVPWVLGTPSVPGGHAIYKWTGTNWALQPGGATAIAVGPGDTPWIVNSANQIFRWTAAGWALQPGAATSIAISPEGTTWVTGTPVVPGGHAIYSWTGTNWALKPGGATAITVGPDGTPWVINNAGQIYQSTLAGWILQPGSATAISQGADGTVWITGTNAVNGGLGLYRWNGTTWTNEAGGATTLAVGPTGSPWVTNTAHQIYRSS